MAKQKEMSCEFKWPWMGVLIPSLLISYIYLTTSYISYYDSTISNSVQIGFQMVVMMLFLSYYLAIVTPPGSPPKTFQIDKSIKPQKKWYKYCVKCRAYKPERTHHCRKCQKCVLKMDHHCPWIYNCIGYYNLPHFFRFVLWVVISVLVATYIYSIRLIKYYKMRNLPSYLISKTDLVLSMISFLCCIFLLFTVGILFIRTLVSITKNQTTIEVWEMDRVQEMFFTESFWTKVRANFELVHPNLKFPELTSWKVNYRLLKKDTKIPLNFTFEDLVFPYDLGSAYENFVDSMGPFYQWLFPWGGPSGDGMHFIIDTLNEDQLNLPFPIDGSNFEPNDMNAKIDENNETVVKSWSNYLGESLNDFGVDLETEEYELVKTE